MLDNPETIIVPISKDSETKFLDGVRVEGSVRFVIKRVQDTFWIEVKPGHAKVSGVSVSHPLRKEEVPALKKLLVDVVQESLVKNA